jgi:hypothetical protein
MLEVEPERSSVGELVEPPLEPWLHLGGAGKQHLHRGRHPLAYPGRSRYVQRSGAVGELAVQHQERQTAEVVAVQVRRQHRPDLVGIVMLLLQGDQGGGAAVSRTSPPSSSERCSRMHAWKRPPLPKASPDPMNLTWTGRLLTP